MFSKITNFFYPTERDHDSDMEEKGDSSDEDDFNVEELDKELNNLKNKIKEVEKRMPYKRIVLSQLNDDRNGYYIVYNESNTRALAKGKFKNGNLIQGEKFGYVINDRFIITDANRSNSSWVSGFFNNSGKFEGYGELYDDGYFNKTRLIAKGDFSNGILIKGESFNNRSNQWYIGTFKWDYELYGEGEIYEGYEKTRLIQKGKFKNGDLIQGEYFYYDKWYVGTFVKNCLNGEGKVYEGYEKTRLIKSGKFINDKLYEGEKLVGNKWYVGWFDSNENPVPPYTIILNTDKVTPNNVSSNNEYKFSVKGDIAIKNNQISFNDVKGVIKNETVGEVSRNAVYNATHNTPYNSNKSDELNKICYIGAILAGGFISLIYCTSSIGRR